MCNGPSMLKFNNLAATSTPGTVYSFCGKDAVVLDKKVTHAV